jgi:hypothetical protein
MAATGVHGNENSTSLKSEIFLTSVDPQEDVWYIEYVT